MVLLWKAQKNYTIDVRESLLWASLRDCLAPADVLVLRTTGPKVERRENCFGDFAELWFFVLKRKKVVQKPPFCPSDRVAEFVL